MKVFWKFHASMMKVKCNYFASLSAEKWQKVGTRMKVFRGNIVLWEEKGYSSFYIQQKEGVCFIESVRTFCSTSKEKWAVGIRLRIKQEKNV